MNTLTKVLAPVALVLAAFGAQAGEVTPGDIGLQAVQPGSAMVFAASTPTVPTGEVLASDIGAQPVMVGSAARMEVARRGFQQPDLSVYYGA